MGGCRVWGWHEFRQGLHFKTSRPELKCSKQICCRCHQGTCYSIPKNGGIPLMKIGIKWYQGGYVREVALSIMGAHEDAKKQHSAFIKSTCGLKLSFHEPTKKDKISLFSNRHTASMWTAQKITCTYLDGSIHLTASQNRPCWQLVISWKP